MHDENVPTNVVSFRPIFRSLKTLYDIRESQIFKLNFFSLRNYTN